MGLAFANAALTAGHIVIATSRNPSKSTDLVSHFTSHGSHRLPLDVSAPDNTLNAQLDAAIALYGRIDVLINNAGAVHRGPVELMPMEDVRRVFEVNVFGTWRVTKKIVSVMREQKSGVIMTNGSIFGFMSFPCSGIYSSTKHALVGLMDSLSAEMLSFGVQVMILEAGGVR
jgi:NAD(P)-dependent dehydrogenase (short-subunit alcohol dehydrogenase family)